MGSEVLGGAVLGYIWLLLPGFALMAIALPLSFLVRLARIGPRAFREEMRAAVRAGRESGRR